MITINYDYNKLDKINIKYFTNSYLENKWNEERNFGI